MSQIQRDVLLRIGEGGWVFDIIQPLFYSSLKGKTYSHELDLTTTQLALLCYLEINLSKSTDFPDFIEPHRFKKNSDFELLSHKVFAAGTPSGFTEAEKEIISNSTRSIYARDPSLSELIRNIFTTWFRIKNSPFSGASSPHAYGMYFIGDKFFTLDLPEKCLSFVHELGHQELFLINLLDRLVEKEADFNLVHAPFQGRSRPPIGRLHSLTALFRMLEYCNTFGGQKRSLIDPFYQTVKSFEDGELTPYGKQVVNAMAIRMKNCLQ